MTLESTQTRMTLESTKTRMTPESTPTRMTLESMCFWMCLKVLLTLESGSIICFHVIPCYKGIITGVLSIAKTVLSWPTFAK